MAKGKKNDEVLYRVVKFEIKPTGAQLAILHRVSDNLFLVWNEGLEERFALHREFIDPLYVRLKEAHQANKETDVGLIRKELASAYKEHNITLFDQINALTGKRRASVAFAKTPRNWQEETLDTLDGAMKSYVALRKNGDPKARMPRLRDPWDFNEIPGRSGFKVAEDGKSVSLSFAKLGDGTLFVFSIPEDYQLGMLARAVRVKKFTLFRDERDMRKAGRYWISLAYEISRPETTAFEPSKAVYVALGASSIGVISPRGEEIIKLWRADKHWKPLTDAIKQSQAFKGSGSNRHPLTEGSLKAKKLAKKRVRMFKIMGAQQKQDRREVALDLILYHGVHLVLTEVVVRSKKGKLADGQNKERGGSLGLNWQAQNTGAFGYLALWLAEKVKEYGGSVRTLKLGPPFPSGDGHENKIPMARKLRDDFLRSVPTQTAA